MTDEIKQFDLVDTPSLTLEDLSKVLSVRGNRIFIHGVMQTSNFIKDKRGVQIKFDGLNSTGGTINGATGDLSDTTVTGSLTVTGSIIFQGTTVGLYNKTPVVQASSIGQLTNSTGGSISSTINDVTVIYSQSILNNNFASLLTKVNALEAALKNIGISA